MGMGLGRVNDLIADKKGGVYFTTNTGSGVFYIKPGGEVIGIGEKYAATASTSAPMKRRSTSPTAR